jgi:polyhydroxyalkanoate synthesis regulator phasin
MARGDRLKRVQEAGADFLETARARAEEFLRELAKASDVTQDRAQGALDDLVGGSRKGTEQIISSIRKEISTQLGILGLATRYELADLEARLNRKAAAPGGPAPAKSPRAKKAPVKKAAPAQEAPAQKAPAQKAAASKKAVAAKKTAPTNKAVASKKAAPVKQPAPAKTALAKKTTARKTTAKKTPAKKVAG